MHVFRDVSGRTWTIVISVFSVKRCRALVDVDLYGLVDAKFENLGKLLGDPVKLIDVIYVLCQDEAEKRGVSDEDFGRGMAGDSLEHATNAFLEELVDFFPDPRARTGLKRVLEAGRTLQARMGERMMTELDNLDLDDVARRLSDSSGNGPGSSGSIPGRSRSGNSG